MLNGMLAGYRSPDLIMKFCAPSTSIRDGTISAVPYHHVRRDANALTRRKRRKKYRDEQPFNFYGVFFWSLNRLIRDRYQSSSKFLRLIESPVALDSVAPRPRGPKYFYASIRALLRGVPEISEGGLAKKFNILT